MLDAIKAVSGTRPDTCPWNAYRDPEVVTIIDLYHAASSEGGALLTTLLPMDPSVREWKAVQFYSSAVARCSFDIKKRREIADGTKGGPGSPGRVTRRG